MFELGIEILPYRDFNFETALKEISALGYKWVNLWSSKAPLPHHVNPGDNPKEVLSLLRKYDLKPSALSIYVLNLEETKERIELAEQLGISTVIFHCQTYYDDFVQSFIPPVLDFAKKHGVRIAVENQISVPFTENFQSEGHGQTYCEAGVDTLAQIDRLITEINDPNLGICLAPAHLWVLGETISQVINHLMERKKLFFYYAWDISRNYSREKDGLNFGSTHDQLPRADGTLDHAVLFKTLNLAGYDGIVSLCSHATEGWSLEKVTSELAISTKYLQKCIEK